MATLTVAQFGADVIKIEQPGSGDSGRRMPPLIDGVGAYFLGCNAGKRSVAINLV